MAPSLISSPGVLVCCDDASYVYGLVEPYWTSYKEVWQVPRFKIQSRNMIRSIRHTRLADDSEALEFAHNKWPGRPVWFFRSPLLEGVPIVEGQMFLAGLALEAELLG